MTRPLPRSPRISRLSLDHLVGAGEERSRQRQAERSSRLQVDDQLEIALCLNRKVPGLLALEDPVDVARSPPVLLEGSRPVGHEPAVRGVVAVGIHGGEPKSRGERNDYVAMK